MSISFVCPHCEFHTEVAERFAGQSGTCANCRQSITVPGKPIENAQRTRKSGGGTGWIVVGGVVGLAIFAAALMGMMFLFVGKPVSNSTGTTTTAVFQSQNKEQMQCGDNLRKIGVAIEKYVAANGHYPPAYVTDENGKPMHSWRVLLLPYLDENKVFAKYDMGQPWDAPVNQAVIAKMPNVYRCPIEKDVTDESTYMLITGEGLMFDGDTKRTPAELKDDPSSILMVVEVFDTTVQWTEPKDLHIDTIDWSRGGKSGLGSKHPSGGLHVLTADGEVHHLGTVPPEALMEMATIDGGESVEAASWSSQ